MKPFFGGILAVPQLVWIAVGISGYDFGSVKWSYLHTQT